MVTAKNTNTDGLFTFTHDGETYTFEKPFSVVRNPKWIRENRRRDETDITFTILEELAGDKALGAIDSMSMPEFEKFQKSLNKAMNPDFQ